MANPIDALPPAPSRATPSNFSIMADAFIAALATFRTQLNAVATAFNLNATAANSVTSLAIGTGSKALTVDISKSYLPGMSVKVARTSSPSNWMHGDVASYNSGTGVLVVNVTNVLGSGTYTDWTITFSAPTGVPVATAESDFLVAGPSPFAWIKKTLAEIKTLLGIDAATTSATGVVELATDAEAIAATSVSVVLSPANLAAKYGAYAIHEVSEFPDDHTKAGLDLLDDANAAAQRSTLGLDSMATQAANNVAITGGSIAGITDLAVADGGTGAGTASAARTNLGLAIGADVMAYEAWPIHEITESGE